MDGILCLDKPDHMTSFSGCAVMRHLVQEKKIGHAGTLDPNATGVLPLFLGRATRLISLLPVHDKCYRAAVQFGCVSDTLDIWGTVTETGAPFPTRAAIDAVLPAFRGSILQVPPMTSALKHDGVRLYDLARQGIEVERDARPVTIYALDVIAYDALKGELILDCTCSAGTYIRTLADDLGRALGCGAVMSALRRTMAAGFSLADCVTLEDARRRAQDGTLGELIRPMESAFAVYPAIRVTPAQTTRFKNGGSLALDRLPVPVSGPVRVHGADDAFLGLGSPEGDQLAVLRVCI